MAQVIYLLCAATAMACGVLLLRGWLRNRVRLLLWCALFFFTLMAENLVLFVDLVLMPDIDLSPLRNSVAAAGVFVFVAGLAWETN